VDGHTHGGAEQGRDAERDGKGGQRVKAQPAYENGDEDPGEADYRADRQVDAP
jgi:hypothetical protein